MEIGVLRVALGDDGDGEGPCDAEGGIVIAHAGAEAGGEWVGHHVKEFCMIAECLETVCAAFGYDQLISVLRGEFEPEVLHIGG